MVPTSQPFLPVPAQVTDAAGLPRFGTYAGELDEVRLENLASDAPVTWTTNVLRRKRWHYTLISTREVLLATATADLGYVAHAFLCAVDLGQKKVLVDQSFLSVPGPLAEVGNRPGKGMLARFVGPRARFSTTRPADRYRVQADVLSLASLRHGGVHLDAEILAAGAGAPLTVIAPVEGGVLNVTQKSSAMLALGTFRAGGHTYALDGGVAGMDYTHGLLARKTAWRWAFGVGRLADGTPVGFNLVEGFNASDARANENAVWVGARQAPLARARFEFKRADVLEPWEISSEDGGVQLRFRPIHAHQERMDLKVVQSKFVQVLGVFSGSIRVGDEVVPFEGIPGVTEDQDMLW